MSNSKIKVNTLGSCVTRDIFRICDNEKIYDMHGNLGFISPLSMFSEGIKDDKIIQKIKQCSATNFNKRNAILDLTGEAWNYIAANKSEYLIVDFGCICLPFFEKDNIRVTSAHGNQGESKVLVEELPALGFKKYDFLDLSTEEIFSCVDKYCTNILNEWDSEKIILIADRPTNMFLNKYHHVEHEDFMDSLYVRMRPEFFSAINRYAAQRLACKVVEMPDMQYVMADAKHTFGWHCLHYTDIVYEYFFEQIKTFTIKNYDSKKESVLNRLKIEYYQSYNREYLLKNYSDNYVKILSTDNMFRYLENLQQLKNCLVVIAIKDTAGMYLDERIQSRLFKLGLVENLQKQYMVGYVGIIKDGVVIQEHKSPKGGVVQYCSQIDYCNLLVSSAPYNNGNNVVTNINGTDYSVNTRGLNVVVYDLLKDQVIDSVSFDTHLPNLPCKRRGGLLSDTDIIRTDIHKLKQELNNMEDKVEKVYAVANLLLEYLNKTKMK